MHVRVHRPVVCYCCSSEMAECPDVAGWFRCVTCGAKRRDRDDLTPLGRDG